MAQPQRDDKRRRTSRNEPDNRRIDVDDINKDNLPGCCEGGQCCSPTPGGDTRKPDRWKSLMFSGVILLACAVAAYSLFWRSPDAATSACCPPGSAAAVACGSSAVIPVFDHSMAPAGLSLYLLLSATDSLSQQQFAVISEVRGAVESKGSRLELETLRPSDGFFPAMVSGHGITSFPAFLVFGQRDSLTLSLTSFRSDTILSVFVLPAESSEVSTTSETNPQ